MSSLPVSVMLKTGMVGASSSNVLLTARRKVSKEHLSLRPDTVLGSNTRDPRELLGGRP